MKLPSLIFALFLLALPAFATVRNVKTTCGAAGDGTTNDTAAINSCIALLVPGDTLLFPAGTYKISSTLNNITVSNVTIDGSSGAATIKGSVGAELWDIGNSAHSSAITVNATANELSQTITANWSTIGATSGSYLSVQEGGVRGNTSSGVQNSTAIQCDNAACRGEILHLVNVSGTTATVETMLHDTIAAANINAGATGTNNQDSDLPQGLVLISSPLSGLYMHDIVLDCNSVAFRPLWLHEIVNATFTNVTAQNCTSGGLVESSYNLAFNNLILHTVGCVDFAIDFVGVSNLTISGSTNDTPGGQAAWCSSSSGGPGGFGFKRVTNSTFSNISIDRAGVTAGRTWKQETSRYNTFSGITLNHWPHSLNGQDMGYYTAHDLFSNVTIENSTGGGCGDGGAAVNGFGNYDQFLTWYNPTITNTANTAFFPNGTNVFQDINWAVLGGNIGGSSTPSCSIAVMFLAPTQNTLVSGVTVTGPGSAGIQSNGTSGNNCYNNNVITSTNLNVGTGGTAFNVVASDRGTGNSIGGNSSNLTAGACSTTGANGSGPLASLSSTSLSFGSQTVGTTSAAQILTISNLIGAFSGTSGLTFVSQSLQSGAQFAFTSGCTGKTIAPGSTCSLSVTFKPTIAGAFTDVLTILDNAGGAMQTIALSGTGTGAASAPTVTTTTATSISSTTAVAGGTVTSNGGASIIDEGVAYGTSANPTSPCTGGGTASPYSTTLTGLTPNTLYHIRFCATNSAGTGYGSDLTFTTLTAGTCSVPTFSPVAPATTTTLQLVTLTSSCSTITYCTDTTNSCTPSLNYVDPIPLGTTAYVRTNASQTGFTSSATVSGLYTVNAPAVQLPQNWVNNLEWVGTTVNTINFPSSSTGGSWTCGATTYGPYTAGSQTSLQTAVNNAEACRTANGSGTVIVVPAGATFTGTTQALTLPQTAGDTSTNFIVLISSTPPTTGQTLCSHGIQDNVAASTQPGIRNLGCNGTAMSYQLGTTVTSVSGAFTLANGTPTNTSAYNDLAELFTLTCTSGSCSGVATGNADANGIGPHHFAIIGAEIKPQAGLATPNSPVRLGSGTETANSQLASHIHVAYSYLHGDWTDAPVSGGVATAGPTGANSIPNGIAFNGCIDCSITYSYLDRMLRPGSEGHGIYLGLAQQIKIVHNWQEGQSIGRFTGGQATNLTIPGFVGAQDVEDRANRYTYPRSWILAFQAGFCVNGLTCSGNGYGRKNSAETKTALRYLYDGNINENIDNSGGQQGITVSWKTTNGGGTNYWIPNQNLTMTNNVMRNSCQGVSWGFRSVLDSGNGAGVTLPTTLGTISNNLTYNASISNPGCSGSSPLGSRVNNNDESPWAATAVRDSTGTTATLTLTAVPGGGQSNMSVGDPVNVTGCRDASFNTPPTGLTLAIAGTLPNTLKVVYPNAGTANASTNGCTFDNLQGWPRYLLFSHNSDFISDGNVPTDPYATGNASPLPLSRNLSFVNNVFVGGGLSSGFGEGTRTATQAFDATTLALNNDLFAARDAAVTCPGHGSPAAGGMAACYTEYSNTFAPSTPTTLYGVPTPFCTGNDPTVGSCVGVLGAMSQSSFPAVLNDWHSYRLCHSGDAACNSKASIYSAGQADQAPDGTDLGVATPAIDTAETSTLYTCATSCGTGPFADTVATPTAATPTISPAAGTYTAPLTVTGTTTSSGAILCYNLTGSPATNHASGCAAGSTLFTGGVILNTSGTVYFVAGGAGYLDSSIASTAYTINQIAVAPTFAPGAGTYTGTQSVTISTTKGGVICYTTNGSTPATNGTTGCTTGTKYTAPVSVSVNETLKAIAGGSGFVDSTVSSAAYVITPVAGTPVFNPIAGTYTGTQSITITTPSGSVICYTTNGTTPATNGTTGCTTGTLYSSPVSLAVSETLKAIAGGSGFTDGAVASAAYTIVSGAAIPTFSPVAGTYTSTQSVTISTTSGGAIICYNTTGAPHTNGTTGCAAGSTLYSTPVSVSSTETLYAVAGGTGFTDSTVGSASYVILTTAATPTFAPPAGTYTGTQTVAISTTSGTTICYTTNGTTPATNGGSGCTSGLIYLGPISVAASETVKAIAGGAGFADSGVGSAAYVINAGAATPTFSPIAGTYSSAQNIVISTASVGAIICYTLNGSTPATNGTTGCTTGTKYSGAVNVPSSETIKAVAGGTGFTDSSVGSAAYVILPPASQPAFSPVGGTYASTQSVTITAATGGVICYTLDGTAPSTNGTTGCANGTLYSGAISVATSETIKAIAGGTGFTDGPVASASYVINTIAATPMFNPPAGAYVGIQNVTITSTTPGAILCWNFTGAPATNGSTGCTNGTLYTGPVAVPSSSTLFAVAGGTGLTDSAVGSAAYVIAPPPTYRSTVTGSSAVSGTGVLQ